MNRRSFLKNLLRGVVGTVAVNLVDIESEVMEEDEVTPSLPERRKRHPGDAMPTGTFTIAEYEQFSVERYLNLGD
ncbi:MAG: hypothetical protein ACXABY_11830 [Candidatus Thorarchaeota archaeon]|jgi:hypothetical protein